jgi:putative chitinase
MIARGRFFQEVRPLFGSLSQSQVDGMNVILDMWQERYLERTPPAQLSDCLGTTKHETAHTMQPIKELGNKAYFTRMYDITGSRPALARRLGNTQPGDGALFCGRGDVQLTGRKNYWLATQKLRELHFIDGSTDFVADPDKVMQPRLAALIMFEGMEDGWFTGVKLDDVIDDLDGDKHAEFVRARRIINGTDRAEKIATYSDGFLKALKAAGA